MFAKRPRPATSIPRSASCRGTPTSVVPGHPSLPHLLGEADCHRAGQLHEGLCRRRLVSVAVPHQADASARDLIIEIYEDGVVARWIHESSRMDRPSHRETRRESHVAGGPPRIAWCCKTGTGPRRDLRSIRRSGQSSSGIDRLSRRRYREPGQQVPRRLTRPRLPAALAWPPARTG
jgi:hypothetical protein